MKRKWQPGVSWGCLPTSGTQSFQYQYSDEEWDWRPWPTEGKELESTPPLKKIKPLKDYSTWKEEVGGVGTEIHQERDITKWVFYKSSEVEFYILPHLYGVGKPSPRNDFKVVEGWYHSREQMRKQMKILPK